MTVPSTEEKMGDSEAAKLDVAIHKQGDLIRELKAAQTPKASGILNLIWFCEQDMPPLRNYIC